MSNNQANGLRPARYDLAQNMEAFDKLPKAVRQALRESHYNWSAAGIRRDMRKFKIKASTVVAKISVKDAEIDAMNPPHL